MQSNQLRNHKNKTQQKIIKENKNKWPKYKNKKNKNNNLPNL